MQLRFPFLDLLRATDPARREPADPAKREGGLPPGPRQTPRPQAPGRSNPVRETDGTALRSAQLDGQEVRYRLQRSRRRPIGFVIDARGLTVTAPARTPLAEIDQALLQKSRWIARKLIEWRDWAQRRDARAVRWVDGGTLELLGDALTLSVQPGARTRVARDGALLRVTLPGPATAPGLEAPLRDASERWLKAQAKAVFTQRLAAFEREHGVRPARWTLSSARTRWGSCSSAGAIRLNWRLVHFPLPIVDYVIAHELAHLSELNHGPRFWQRVEQLYPDWQRARRWLRDFPDDL